MRPLLAVLAAAALAAAAPAPSPPRLAPPQSAPFVAGVTLLVGEVDNTTSLEAAAPRCLDLPAGVPAAVRTAEAPCGVR